MDKNRHRQSRSGETKGPGAADKRALGHLSHDIRAAMSDVLGGLRLIDADWLDPRTRTQFDRVRASADTLAALVDHALFEASGEQPIARDQGPVVLEEWLASLEDRWRGQVSESGRSFRIHRYGDLPRQISVPPVQLTRVVANLIGNAFRHAANGDVTLDLAVGGDGALTISVQDQGAGYPQEVLEGRADGGMGDQAGSGLGLKIARELSAELGIELAIENRPQGARATLRLAPALLVGDGTAAPEATLPDLSALRIMVAEDNLTNQTILRHMMDDLGARTDFVMDGRAALRALTSDAYDIALLDIEMPEMSGLEVMEAIRAIPGEIAAMPLVAITAYVLRDNREAIYAAGADGIIGKPVSSAADLGHAILRHVGVTSGDAILPDAAPNDAVVLDRTRMDDLMEAAGPEGRAELLLRLGEDLSTTLETLDRAVAEKDSREIRAQTHILIAISGAVGADRLCNASEALNIAVKRKAVERFASLFPALRADLVALIDEVARRRAEEDAGA
ncbi:response regulator [Rhodobacterales bacterium HKCCE4037]|nr:response regulator [Rhodobacterales bacterium HKCCE4037]